MDQSNNSFSDHFSGHAAQYAAYRPGYPASLFEWLAGQTPGIELAWDCATGNGQAAVALAAHFDGVFASDASAQQIAQAEAHPKVRYAAEPAEQCSLPDESADLVTVAQAYHWFDHAAFHREAARVLKPGGVLTAWAYMLAQVNPEFDAVVYKLYEGILGPYWPPERAYVERRYQDFSFPWPDIPAPGFAMTASWPLEAMLQYLQTWSAFRRYQAEKASNPVEELRAEFVQAWGDPDEERKVSWPLVLKVARKV